jgi:hypothetical protein
MRGGRREGQQDREQAPSKIKSRSGSHRWSSVAGMPGNGPGMLADAPEALPARAVLLKAGEQIETVEANAFHGGFPVKAEGGILPLKPPAELPMGFDDEWGDRALFRYCADEPVRLCTSEQIICVHVLLHFFIATNRILPGKSDRSVILQRNISRISSFSAWNGSGAKG